MPKVMPADWTKDKAQSLRAGEEGTSASTSGKGLE